jgi:hypothetical protein
MDMPSLIIVIPIYKPQFDGEEQFLVDRMFSIFSSREIAFMAPESLDKHFYLSRYPKAEVVTFANEFFASVNSYSRLLLTADFYRAFNDREFLLICQPDVYLFRDDMDIWLKKPYDYIGAPWPRGFSTSLNMGRFRHGTRGNPVTAFVGNGGFSLRRVSKCIYLIENDVEISDWFRKTGSNEDLFFSFTGAMTENFVLPNLIEASLFSMETEPDLLYSLNKRQLPMAAHAFRKNWSGLWRAHISLK